jgi:hypothetical protein
MWNLVLMLSSLVGCANVQTAVLKNAFYRAGGRGDESVEPRGRWPENFRNHRIRALKNEDDNGS